MNNKTNPSANPNKNNRSLEVACLEWLKLECVRVKDDTENSRSSTWVTKRLLNSPFGYDVGQGDRLFDEAIELVKNDDLSAGIRKLKEINHLLDEECSKKLDYDGKRLRGFITDLIKALGAGYHKNPLAREMLRMLWFEMIHSFRAESSKGLPDKKGIPSPRRFGGLEAFTVIFLAFIGIVIPTFKTEGIYMIAPLVMFSLAFIAHTLIDLVIFAIEVVLFALVVFVEIYYTNWMVNTLSTQVMLLPTLGGGIAGILVASGLAYRRMRSMADKYGPFACLWTRHVRKDVYEFMMIKTDGSLAWYYQAPGFMRRIEPCLSHLIATDYQDDIRLKGYESAPRGGWFPCYPALISTRMLLGRVHNPPGWKAAYSTTANMTPELAEQFFQNTPSPTAPPPQYLQNPPVKLSRFKPIPW